MPRLNKIYLFIRVNGDQDHNVSIAKPATRKVIKKIKALNENLTPVEAVASAILLVTDVLSTQYALSQNQLNTNIAAFKKEYANRANSRTFGPAF